MNKKQFKRATDNVGASICNQMAAYYNVDGVDREKITVAVAKVFGATKAAKAKANRFFDGRVKNFTSVKEYNKAKRIFFKKLFEDILKNFSEDTSAATKLFYEAVPEDM